MPPAALHVHRFGITSYDDGLELQREFASEVRESGSSHLMLLEHEPTYTFGARGESEHLLANETRLTQLGAVVRNTDRGGDVTFHGPGQLVGYPILDLKSRGQGPRWYVRSLEQMLIDSLAAFGIAAGRSDGRPGVWVGDAKIASIGVRISRSITTHGFALNVDPDLAYFSHIDPCGLPDITMTSMSNELGTHLDLEQVKDVVVGAFGRVFKMEVAKRKGAFIG